MTDAVTSPVSGTVIEVGSGWCAIAYRQHFAVRWWSKRDRVLVLFGMSAVAMRVGAGLQRGAVVGHCEEAVLMADMPRENYPGFEVP